MISQISSLRVILTPGLKANVIEERLDRAMENSKWMMNYPNVKFLNLLTYPSDHSHILLQTSPMIIHGRLYSFLFENGWLKEDDINEVVDEGCGGGDKCRHYK
jgi:hypothetical protein